MKPFKYSTATSATGACKALGDGSVALAGGTNLLNLMKEYVLQPDVLIDLKTIEGISSVEQFTGGLEIGANVTLAQVLSNARVQTAYSALRDALRDAGTPQIRNRATIGGNLCCRPACWYFLQEGFDCAKNGGNGCAAKSGENEFHAIFETDGPCVMVHPSSAAPALLALGARVRIASPAGSSELDLEKFFTLPGTSITKENVLEGNQIITHVILPQAAANSSTYEVRPKAASDWPVSVASVKLDLNGAVCKGARVFLGAVSPAPRRAVEAEKFLVGKRITPAVAEAAGAAAVKGAKPLPQNAYKVAATKAAVKRAVLVAATGKWQ
jgi:xanthine dehydrogenase YagS FAD-binding subunit